MGYDYTKGKNNFNIKIIVVLLLASIISIGALIYGFKFIGDLGNSGKIIYYKIINNIIPVTEIANSEIEMDNHENITTTILEKLNIEVFNPFKIIGFEIPYFNMNEFRADNKENFTIFDSFSLNENSIVKLNPEESNEQKNTEISSVFNPNLKKPLNNNKPEILIYHTHNEEHYIPAKKDTTDENCNIVGVGNILTKELEKYGISVIHDKTMYKDYNNSYKLSNKTVSKYLNQYGGFKLIIDLHRDGGGSKNNLTATFNGENVAKIMFVNAKNSKYYSKNAALAEKMNAKAREIFPGFSRGIHTWNSGKNAFNQGLSPNATLIEVGSNINTIDEAKNSAKYIARIIAETINTKQ